MDPIRVVQMKKRLDQARGVPEGLAGRPPAQGFDTDSLVSARVELATSRVVALERIGAVSEPEPLAAAAIEAINRALKQAHQVRWSLGVDSRRGGIRTGADPRGLVTVAFDPQAQALVEGGMTDGTETLEWTVLLEVLRAAVNAAITPD